MVQLDVSVVNVALAQLERAFGSGVAGLQWVVNGYTLAFAAFLLSAGALGDRFGARRVFAWGFALFTAASAGCGLAPSLPGLVAARAVQGVGAALLVPSSLAMLSNAYPGAAEKAKAVGVWAGGGGLAIAAGPVVGGLLVTWAGWRSIFLVNLPIGLAGFWLTLRHTARSPGSPGRGLDVAGQAAATLTLCALTGAVIEAGSLGWQHPVVRGCLVTFVLAGAAFLAAEVRGDNPMLPLGLFRRRVFATTTAIGLLVNFAFYGLIFVFSLFFQQVQGYPPFWTGLAFLPLTALFTVVNVFAGKLTASLGPRLPLVGGLLLAALGYLALLPTRAGTSYVAVAGQLLTAGAGVALAVPPLTTALLSSVGRERSGIASGVLNAARQVGGVLGVAIFGAMAGGGMPTVGFVGGMRASLLLASFGLLVACLLGIGGLRPAPSDLTEPGTKAGTRAGRSS